MSTNGDEESEEEQYDFEYEDDDEDEETVDVAVENQYYNAKQMRDDNPAEAISQFLELPSMEGVKGDWGFKGLKQALKLEYLAGKYDAAVEHYTELLTYVKSAVTRNYSEKSINNILDFIERETEDSSAYQCMETFYQRTLSVFAITKNERLWLKTEIKLAKLFLERKRYTDFIRLVRKLHNACQNKDGTVIHSKGTYALDIYALEIQMYAETRNNNRLKALYQRALRVRSVVAHPLTMAIIRECGGKMHMSEGNWKEAQIDFSEAFRSYDEAGSLQRLQVLKYLVLTTMLMKSEIDPFESQETKPYKADPRISAMTNLVEAYQENNILRYQSILHENQDLLADPFIAENIDEVTQTLRTSGVLRIITPYARFSLGSLAKLLKISVIEMQNIIGFLILDDQLDADIDEDNGLVEVNSRPDIERIYTLHALSHEIQKFCAASLVHLEDPKAKGASKSKKGKQSGKRKGRSHTKVVHTKVRKGATVKIESEGHSGDSTQLPMSWMRHQFER